MWNSQFNMITISIYNQNIILDINATLINQETEYLDDTRIIKSLLFYDKIQNLLYKYRIEIYTNYERDEEGNIISENKITETFPSLDKIINLNEF